LDPARFNSSQREHLVKTIGGAWAFVPPPLPPKLSLAALANSLTSASLAIGELNGVAQRLPNPYFLIRPLQRREALTSSAMEGTITTLGDMVLEEAKADAPQSDDAREALNYIRALDETDKMLKRFPISHRVIKQAHTILLQGLSSARGAGKRPGQYKVHQNAIGKPGETIHTARYVPPPPQQTLSCMDSLEAYINRETVNATEKLIDLALVHYQFESIHPFDDGNGRIGRMIVTLLAQQSKLLDLPLLHVSAFLEQRKDDYIDHMFAVSTAGKWEEWVVFFLGAVEASCAKAIELAGRIAALQKSLTARASGNGKSPRLAMIADRFFEKQWAKVSEIQELCKVSFPTAQSDLRKLVQLGILRELSTKNSRIYIASEILELSERG
jgi:Fic family protein